MAVVPSSVLSVLATIRSAKWQSSSSMALPIQTAPPAEHVAMEISESLEEGEAPRPKDKGRAVAPSSSLMDVDEAFPEAAEHVQPEDVQRAQQETLTWKRRRCRSN